MSENNSPSQKEQKLWENVLSTDLEKEYRKFVINQLPLSPDDSVLSAGCGPGFETAALAQQISEQGSITGIDVNEDVLAAARDRCSEFPQVSFKMGDITDLPAPDESYDLVIAKQVLSETGDVESTLNELNRVLKPNGWVAVTAGDRRAHIKHTPTDLMERADHYYRSEIKKLQLGTRLVGLLPEAGFQVEEIIPRTKIQTEINDQVEYGITVQRKFLEASDEFGNDETERWEKELRELDEANQFLSAGAAFLYLATNSK